MMMAGLPTGIMGNLMYMAKQSADAEAARRAELAQQQMDMMQKGYDVNQAPERGGNAFFNALTRSFAYDPSMDPTPTYTRNQYNPQAMALEGLELDKKRFDLALDEFEQNKKLTEAQVEEIREDTTGKKNENRTYEERHQLWLRESKLRLDKARQDIESGKADIDYKKSLIDNQKQLLEANQYDLEMLKESAAYNEELRGLNLDKLKVDIVTAKHKFYQLEDGTVLLIDMVTGDGSTIYDGAASTEQKKFAEAAALSRILSTQGLDGSLRDALNERIKGLLEGNPVQEAVNAIIEAGKDPNQGKYFNIYRRSSTPTPEPIPEPKETDSAYQTMEERTNQGGYNPMPYDPVVDLLGRRPATPLR